MFWNTTGSDLAPHLLPSEFIRLLHTGCLLWRPTLGPKVALKFGRLKATLGDFSLVCPKLRAILGDLRRFWATLGAFGRF